MSEFEEIDRAHAPSGVWLFRHGEPEPAPERRFVGQRDVPLSARGRAAFEEEARRFAAELGGPRPAVFFCSDLARSVACADILRRAFRPSGGTMPVVASPVFREISLGAWEGLSKDEVERRWPGALAERGRHMDSFAPPGGESFAMLQRRAVMAMLQARRHTPQGLLVLVGHQAFNRCVLADWLSLPLADAVLIPQPFGARTYLPDR